MGAWFNGRTAVSKTVDTSSILVAPAKIKIEATCHGRFYYINIINIGIFSQKWYH